MPADFSEFLKREGRVAAEERGWVRVADRPIGYKFAASVVKSYLEGAGSVVEFCCGSGNIPTELPKDVAYTGLDASSDLLELARKKNEPEREFVLTDIRETDPTADIACCFQALKHFGFHEWGEILKRVLHAAPTAVFSMNIADDFIDNGIHYHHTWIPLHDLEEYVESGGHRIVYSHEIWSGRAPGRPLYTKSVRGSDHIFVTQKVNGYSSWEIVDGKLVITEE